MPTPDAENPAYDAELRARLIQEAEDPDLTARLLEEFEAARNEEERIYAEQWRSSDQSFDKTWDKYLNTEDEDEDQDEDEDEDEQDHEDRPDPSLRRSDIRENLADARRDRILEEQALERGDADWRRTSDRIADLEARFDDIDARPEVVDIELGGLYAVSELQWDRNERQRLVLELARQRERHYEALLGVIQRMRSLEQSAARAHTPHHAPLPSRTISSAMLWVAVVAGVIFAGVGLNELTYISNHPHSYGPAKVIAWACGAGLLISIAVVGVARDVASREQ